MAAGPLKWVDSAPSFMRPLPVLPLLLLAPLLALAAPPSVTAAPERVVLGRDTRVVFTVRVPEDSGPVRAAASSGEFVRESVEGGPVRTFQWTPPAVRYPLAAVLLFWVDGPQGEAPEVARVVVPLLGRMTLDIATKPGAEVVVEVANSRFGPVTANARGQARVPVEVPPGVKEARVLATQGNLRTDRAAPFEVPPNQPLVAALSPSPLHAERGGWLLVSGEPEVTAVELDVEASGGRAVPREEHPLRYRVRPSPGATLLSVTVHRQGARDSARASATVLPAPPGTTFSEDEEPVAPPRRAEGKLGFHVLAGGYIAASPYTGPAAALGASYRLPVWRGRVAAELEAGLRQSSLDASLELGTARSRVLAGPLLASARFTALERGALSLYGRVGAGVVPFENQITTDFQPSYREGKLGAMAFLAAQGAWRFGAVSALLEVRGAVGPSTKDLPSLKTEHSEPLGLGGLAVNLGLRYAP